MSVESIKNKSAVDVGSEEVHDRSNKAADTTIVNAITGDIIDTDLKFFATFNDFRKFIVSKWFIPLDQLLILLPFGSKLKQSNFNNMFSDLKTNGVTSLKKQLYVFDRRCFSTMNKPSILINGDNDDGGGGSNKQEILDRSCKLLDELIEYKQNPMTDLSLIQPVTSPLSEINIPFEKDKSNLLPFQKITSIVTTNLGWLSALEIDVYYLKLLIKDTVKQIDLILESLNVCLAYLNMYSYDAEKLLKSNISFFHELREIKKNSIDNWENHYDNFLTGFNDINGHPLTSYINKKDLFDYSALLIKLDNKIDDNFKKIVQGFEVINHLQNDTIGGNVTELKKSYSISDKEEKYRLENEMLPIFEDLLSSIRNSSHEILELDELTVSKDQLIEFNKCLLKDKNDTVKKLYTISRALYSQAEDIFNIKKKLQIHSIVLLGQISFTQIEILNVKNFLLNESNKDLQDYQKWESKFASIFDLPIVYTLESIEIYRRKFWYCQVLLFFLNSSNQFDKIINAEISLREKWLKIYDLSLIPITAEDTSSNEDLKQLCTFLFNTKDPKKLYASIDREVKALYPVLEGYVTFINTYIEKIAYSKTNEPVLGIIQRNFKEAKNLSLQFDNISDSNTLEIENEDSETKLINRLQARIKKLEGLLHDATFLNGNSWPPGLLKTSFFQKGFQDSNRKLLMDSSSTTLEPNVYDVEVVRHRDVMKLQNLQSQVNELKDKIKLLTLENATKDEELLNQRNSMVDLTIEKNAYRETLNHLNTQLTGIANAQERNSDIKSYDLQLKKQIDELIEINKSQTTEYNALAAKFENAKIELESIEEKGMQIQERQAEEIELLERNSHDQQQEINQLKEKIKVLPDTETEGTQTESLSEERLAPLSDKGLALKVFDILTSNVYILENIGLLLTTDEKHKNELLIRRVKGLKKDVSQSLLDESVRLIEPSGDNVSQLGIKSDVYHELKSALANTKNGAELGMQFSQFIEKFYDDKLFATAVIKRFKDIEFLAKKLTKENKLKSNLLENLNNQKIALKSFQAGDLALFLPTRENDTSSDASSPLIASLNSSFSSVDLSTPPSLPLDAASSPQVSKTRQRAGKTKQNYNRNSANVENKKVKPWAAFTASENGARYLFKDSELLPVDREWFIGKIRTVQKNTVTDFGANPLRLVKGSVWYELTADIIYFA
ncbi:hypothetical protein KAFR_0H01060 [Kazachstania africana CBS 2517]|uniref:Autophagy-related protein 11 n=1 Tax=Kazachstania africana (strain ATCC 22294 / BCRC 22015 / CBS 2517 / CECT 1963 / NBRC 1671 / NRRL Y-8276) TaxID=1071382 RepID=H2AYW0_KAZAF|nr:hypothetical protein KAFR_0H01060 [Kazachstania africana CBS 2517]CCF59516.1 hypothetical protein KAFR_0H01060 [Kazachstania africana CBS 2517]